MAILAILAIIAVPRILNALDNARRSEAEATATVIADAMEQYYTEREVYPELDDVDFNDSDVETDLLDVDGPANTKGHEVPLSNYLEIRNPDSFEFAIAIVDDEGAPSDHNKDWQITLRFLNAKELDEEGEETGQMMQATIRRDRIIWDGWAGPE